MAEARRGGAGAGDRRDVPAEEHLPPEMDVRDEDMEPHEGLRYIARLFKILAVLMVIMLIGELIAGVTRDAAEAFPTLIAEITQMLVLAGLMWGGGDLTLLVIDAGHDLRVARILLGRINAELHRKAAEDQKKK